MSARLVRIGVVSAALALAAGSVPGLAPVARAAPPEVPITSLTTYSVVPDRNVIQVVVDATLTSHIQDTPTVTYYVNEAYLGLLPGATNLRATGPGGVRLATAVAEQTADYVLGRVRLSANVFMNQSYQFQLVYDLPGVGDGAAPFTHADESFAAFPVWAHSTPETPGNQVRVILPAGYEVGLTYGDLPEPTTGEGGTTVYDFGVVENADTFFAFFSAKRHAGLATLEIHPRVGDETVRVLLRGWADDPDWLAEVAPVIEAGLPVLGELIGLPYPGLHTLYVDETVSWLTAGYAGLYDPSTGIIEVTELADDFVVLHEAAHTWMNGRLFAERWMAEGFADWYAARAAEALGLDVSQWAPDEPATLRFPLAEWPPLDRANPGAEPYGYKASMWAVHLIGQRAGAEGLAAVLDAIANHEAAYQPANAAGPEPSASFGPADARELLDQLEERTGQRYDDIWLIWILPPADSAAMSQRLEARRVYGELVEVAGPWELPRDLRRAMDGWQFDDARRAMRSASKVLDDWGAIAAAAKALDLSPTDAVEVAFEAGDWEVAVGRATDELDALDSLAGADAALDAQPDIVESVGLLGEDLAVDLAEAGDAYEAGELEAATETADAVAETRAAARDIGLQRLAIGGGGLIVVGGGSVVGVWLVRRRRAAAAVEPSAEGEASAEAEPGAEATTGRPAEDATEDAPET